MRNTTILERHQTFNGYRMADLYNLLGDGVPQEPEEDSEGEGDGLTISQGEGDGDDWDSSQRDDQDLPAALQEAAKKKRGRQSTSTAKTAAETEYLSNDSSFGWADETSSDLLSSKEAQLSDLAYTKLKHWWIQELHSPEIQPYDDDLLNEIFKSLEEREEYIDAYAGASDYEDNTIATGNANMDAMLASLLRIDSERAKFLVSDILKLRLHKIESHPTHHVQQDDLKRRMSQNELQFLKEYGSAMERHLHRTVLDHFPQDAFKNLYEPNMIDKPNLDQYVFVTCTKDTKIRPAAEKKAGDYLIVRYGQIRENYLRGEVEMLM